MGRKKYDPGKKAVNLTVGLDPETIREVERHQGMNTVPVTRSAMLRWLIKKGIEAVEKEADNAY